jgi:DNA-binding protein H-NS
MATLENLQAKIAMLQAQAEEIVNKDSTAVIAKIHGIMEKHGLTVADIDAHIDGGKKGGRKPGVKDVAKSTASTAKYRDPKSGATWTGHGRAPAWIVSAKDRSKFLVEVTAAVCAPAAKKSAKDGNYVRGLQPALYADPKTGATWSGRGRAPAWLAGAKDRTKFLIAGAVEGKAELKAIAAEKASAKKVATKKPATKKSVVAAKKVSAKKVAAKKTTGKKGVMKKATAKKAMSAKAFASRKTLAKTGTAKQVVPAASKKASTNKVSMTEAAVTAPMGTVEASAGSAT